VLIISLDFLQKFQQATKDALAGIVRADYRFKRTGTDRSLTSIRAR